MKSFQGKSVYKGTVMGPVVVLNKKNYQVKQIQIEDVNSEIVRLQQAIEQAKEQLRVLHAEAAEKVGVATAAIFEVHQMILEDENYLATISNMIRNESVNAEYAVMITGDRISQRFATMDDDYMKARAMDVADVFGRVVRNLNGQSDMDLYIEEPSIIIAEDISPSETMQMDRNNILAFVMERGSTNSHAAILARMMNIPALVGVPLEPDAIQKGDVAIVDGCSGQIILEPTEEIKKKAEKQIRKEQEQIRLLHDLKGKETVTQSGHKVDVYANIGSVTDIEYVLENDAEGIGLFRSECLYLGKTDYPTEEEQYQVYKQALEMMDGKKVTIRTLDIGVDKQTEYFGLDKEENPALGYRAIRICLKQPEMFKTQLRALFRAAVCGNLSVTYPMITSIEEVQRIYQLVEEVKAELNQKGVAYGIPKQGIMIETPAAVMISDELAEMVDFFSIGTNDLTQYTLAIDRQNEKLDEFYNPHHKAVLRMIRMVVENAHKCGKRVGICGELGADTELTEEFVRMGVDELSVAPSMVLRLRKIIREMK